MDAAPFLLAINVGTGQQNPMTSPDTSLELSAIEAGYLRIAGVDEVGRGPLAGPVTAAAVILDLSRVPEGLNDSKKLTARARAKLDQELWQVAEVSVAHASVGGNR